MGDRPIFVFRPDDIVLIGQGPLADEAKISAELCRATTIVLDEQLEYVTFAFHGMASARSSGIKLDAKERFDVSLARIAAGLSAYRTRFFLAGTVPRTDYVLQALKRMLGADMGAHPERLEAAGLSSIGAALKLVPSSLHSVSLQTGQAQFVAQPRDADEAAMIDRGLVHMHSEMEKAAKSKRRLSRDDVCIAFGSVITSSVLEDGETKLLRAACEFPFDTAFLDHSMVRAYADEGFRRVAFCDGIILVNQPELRAQCARSQLDLVYVRR